MKRLTPADMDAVMFSWRWVRECPRWQNDARLEPPPRIYGWLRGTPVHADGLRPWVPRRIVQSPG